MSRFLTTLHRYSGKGSFELFPCLINADVPSSLNEPLGLLGFGHLVGWRFLSASHFGGLQAWLVLIVHKKAVEARIVERQF